VPIGSRAISIDLALPFSSLSTLLNPQDGLKPVPNKADYISALRAVILRMHGCQSVHLRTEHVHETVQGRTVWDEHVEVFILTQHPKADTAYAWAQLEGPEDEEVRYVVVLGRPPVIDAKTAVQSVLGNSQTGQF
jgi:hypothetical protein